MEGGGLYGDGVFIVEEDVLIEDAEYLANTRQLVHFITIAFISIRPLSCRYHAKRGFTLG